jgi:hypothetical protein
MAQLRGPPVPPAAARAAGSACAQVVMKEAVAAQQRLAVFEEETWPGVIEAALHRFSGLRS